MAEDTPLQFYYHSGQTIWGAVFDPVTKALLQAAVLAVESGTISGLYEIIFAEADTGHAILVLTEQQAGGKRLPDGTLHYLLADTTDPHFPGDALLISTIRQPGQGTPPVDLNPLTILAYLYKAWRNLSTQTADKHNLYADDGSTVDQQAPVTFDGTTTTKGKIVSGP